MKTKQNILLCLTITAIVGGIILNFREFVNDYWKVSNKNVIVTFAYLSIWLLVLIAAIKNKYIGILKSIIAFWLTTFILVILVIYFNVTGSNASWLILPVLLSLSQWVGLKFFIESYLHIYIIIAIISLFILISGVIAIYHYKGNHSASN